ncbi:MAG: UDP-glucose 4-epimerase GalE [Alphaproteobacteria bacterium RIFCSPHIGHO2_02_FULL_46_13]|nr:MAG: UDP-glucose 4-epimerase GalE [Alphaproteobacteria bacterium RIFCSPHIGHO2_02_FULL_46_13]
MENKTIIVTGGAGYIGSHTAKALHEAGYIPVVVDNLSKGHRNAVKWGVFEQGDIGDMSFMRGVFDKYKPAGVVHFAASIEVGESNVKPAEYYLNNVAGTLALLTAMRDSGVQRIVFSSTCAVYGEPETVPISEDEKRRPINTYGKTKYMVEMMLEDFSRAYGLHYVALRYFNACGADPSGEIGERHDPETHIIPRAFMAAEGKIDGLTLFGDDYPTHDGTCVRDYIHVNDLARAHIKSFEYLVQGGASMAFNLGAGKGTSVKEIIAAVEAITQKKLSVKIFPRREGDPAELVSNVTLIERKLGFITEWNSIEDIIASAWNFHRKR